MRFALALLAVLPTPSLLAQSDTVRGCIEETPLGVVLRASPASRQTFDSQNVVDEGRRFLLVADEDLLDEIVLRRGQEIQVTGRINPDPPRAIAQPPRLPPPGGNFPGVGRPLGPPGRNPFNPRVSVRQRDSRRPTAEDVIVVEEYQAVRPTCRDPELPTR